MARQKEFKINNSQSRCLVAGGLMAAIAVGAVALGGQMGVVPDSSALTYQDTADVSFTIQPSVSISLSSSELVIDDLAPGQSKDSNIITLTTLSNSPAGYSVGATVGNSTDYPNTNLKHKTDTSASADYFTSLATTDSVADLTSLTAGKWGYAFSLDNGTSWINANKTGSVNNTGYSGLPLYTTTTPAELVSVDTNASRTIQFKIAASSKDTQAAGEYNNVINFIAVANPEPEPVGPTTCPTPVPSLTYMQDLTSANKSTVLASMTEDAQYFLKDKRDDKTYCVSKLRDGNIWMTQNLDLDLDSTKTYTPADTDIPSNWSPVASTRQTSDVEWYTYDPDTNPTGGDKTHAESYNPGNKIWDGVPDDSYSTTLDNMTQGTDPHYHIGNYYNWTAAVAMNDSSSYATHLQDVNQSICPTGWTLPKGGGVDQGLQTQPGSFQYLVEQYGWNQNTWQMENPHMWESPLYFSLSGDWGGGSGDVASYSNFWSPVVVSSVNSYILSGDYDGYVYPDSRNDRSNGFSVRCVSR